MTKVEKEESSAKSENKCSEGRRSERHRGQKKEKVKAPTKILMRHLPPTMTEDEFLKQIDPLPDHDFYYYAPADWSLGYDATCRAYITLKHCDDVFLFRDRFDGYVFVDSKGAEYPAIVEFAPFQGLVKNKSRRSDNKVNLIEQEEHYQQFLQNLQEDREAVNKGEYKLEFSLDRKKEEKITSTPLLQYLANKKEKRREETKKRAEEKRRQREEEKEKRRQGQTQQSQIVTKIYSGQGETGHKESKSAATGATTSESKGNGSEKNDVEMSTRAKRRMERDRRRREAYEQRKKERERERLEQEHKDSVISISKSEKKRERNRNRKEKDKDKEKDKEIEKEKDKKKSNENHDNNPPETEEQIEEGTSNKQGESIETEAGLKEENVNESVMNFIRSVVTAMEFVPKHKQEQREREQDRDHEEQELEKNSTSKELEDEQTVNSEEQKTTTSTYHKQKNATSKEKERGEGEGEYENEPAASGSGNRKQTQYQRNAEERRIRNKDRPSIAIYQPKARMRQSEESDTSASKDIRSNPTSDCESAKREEKKDEHQRVKKVSRYSERRSERRSHKEKLKSSDIGDA